MNLLLIDNVLKDPKSYVDEILTKGFGEFPDGDKVFKGMQPRENDDEFAKFVLSQFPTFKVAYNFVRQSPLNQEEPNFKHKDDMMGDITVILYLNENPPQEDGTTIYNEDETPSAVIHSKFNRMVAFDSDVLHSRNIFENFGEGDDSRLIQVIFLQV